MLDPKNGRKPDLLPNLPALAQILRIIDEITANELPYTSACWFTGCNPNETADLPQHLIDLPRRLQGKADVLGYAGFDPWFIERGFVTGLDGSINLWLPRLGHQPYSAHPDIQPTPKGWVAAREFFGLNFSLAMHLFQRDQYQRGGCTPAAVHERVEFLLALLEQHANWAGDPFAHQTLAVPEWGGLLQHSGAGIVLSNDRRPY